MTEHATGTREEWLAARLELLEAEKELTRRSDELARQRQLLPWVLIDKDYRFDTDEGGASLAELFRGRSQLLIYHFMLGPEYTAGCPSCSAIADGYDGFVVHLENHDVTMIAVSRAPIAHIQAYKRRMGWSFPWASSLPSDFNYDFNVSTTEQQQREGVVEYNFRSMDVRQILEAGDEGPLAEFAATVGTDTAAFTRQAPGMSAFARGGRCRLPHLLGLCPRSGCALGHVPVAGPGTQGAKRDGSLVAPPRRVRQGLNRSSSAAHPRSHIKLCATGSARSLSSTSLSRSSKTRLMPVSSGQQTHA